MEMEAPAYDGTVVAAATNPKKRSLDEVVPPAFVVEDDGRAYGVVEMPKRFVLGNRNKYHGKYRAMMAAYHAMDVRITAMNESARRSTGELIQKLDARDAAHEAAGSRQLG